MQLVVILSVAVGFSVAVMVEVIALRRAATRSDRPMDGALATGRDAEVMPSSSTRRLRTLSLEHAASLLDVEPETVLAWEARYGFPSSSPSEGRYSQSEVLALRSGLENGLSVASAVARAQEQREPMQACLRTQNGPHTGGPSAS